LVLAAYALFEEYAGSPDDEADLSLPPYGIILGLYPRVDEPAEDEESGR
jgi:hypothetical protein